MKKIRFLLLALVGLLGGVTAASGKTVYIQPNAWANDNAIISVNVWVDGQGGNTWVDLTEVETGILKATFDDSFNKLQIVRGPEANKWTNEGAWNITNTLDIEDGKLYQLYDYDNSMSGIYVGHGIVLADYTEPVAGGYAVNFNTSISTSAHDFAVASNWSHLVGSGNYDGYGPYYMSYSYYSTSGVDGTGCLAAGRQYAGDNWGGTECTDLLITPEVKGTITLDVKKSSSSNSFIEFYYVTGSEGAWVKGEQIEFTGDELSETSFVTVTLNVDNFSRIGIRGSNVYMDNFTAEEANIIPEKKITIASAVATDGNSGTTGTIKWNQQANGKVLVKYKVTVTNTGDVDLTQGMDGYSISIINDKAGEVVATIPVPQDLAIGETSDPFDVQAEVETSLWPNTSTYIKFNLRENLKNTILQRAQSGYNAYESKFVFREAGTTATSSISSAQNWGTITESTSKNYEIANTGIAPLTITAYSAPAGFNFTPGFDPSSLPEGVSISGESVILQGGAVVPFTVTQTASATGTYSGTLTIVYQDYGAESPTDYSLAFSATVIGANTWTADFNNSTSTVVYPEGSIAEGGINTDYQYISSGNYNNWLIGRNVSSYATENNKFITPKLHANAGDKLAFDVKAGYSSSDDYFVKVYVSTDRKTWGEPVETYVYSNVGSSFTTKTISFDAEGDYYVAFALYGTGSGIDNLVGLEKVAVAHDLYIKSVNWPDASIKSGSAQTKPSVDIIPLTNETADNYTVKYVCGETVLAEGTPVALTASANSSKAFSFSWTPEVESTTTFPGTKVVFEFTDGTKFETETFDLTVTNEPIFHFVKTIPSSKWYEPTDYTTPITFGKTNTADAQTFYVYNWGSAPLTVKSIDVPGGFTVTPAEQFTVAAFDESDLSKAAQAVEITFSATWAGTYSGNMVITYVNAAGVDSTFTIAVSGTKLDPNKFYANFNDQQWPAGSVYQDNVSVSYINTGDYGLLSSSDTKNIFITPKLTAANGDVLQFEASTRNNYYDGTVKVYVATDRENLGDPVKEIELSKTDNVEKSTFEYEFDTAGDYYVAFALTEARVDEIYGLKLADVEHDWMIASSNIPTEAMQNVATTATVNILNLGLAEEAADSYTATLYLNGEAAATAEAVALPMNHKLSDAGTQLSFSFLTSKIGTFPVYVEVKAGDYSVTTEPVDVTFTEEVFVNDAIVVGAKSGNSSSYAIIDFYNLDGGAKTSDIVYTKDQLAAFGIKADDKITALSFIGTISSAKTISNSLTAWVGLKTGDITWNSPDKTAMTEVTIFDGTMAFAAGSNEIKIDLSANPITYDGNSDLRIYLEGTKGGWASLSFDYDSNYSNMKWSNASSMKYNPLLYVTIDAAPAALAGTVKNTDDEGIAGATITLKAENGVEYSGTTDENGAYSINVIQAGLDFTATIEAEGYLKHEFAYNVTGEPLNETLYKQFGLVGTLPGFSWDNDLVMEQSAEDPSIFTLEMNDVQVEAGTYAFKLRADGKWGFYQLPAGSGNYTDQNNGYDVVDGNYSWNFNTSGTYNFLFTFDWNEHKLTFERPFLLAENAEGVADLNWVDVTVEREFKAGWNAVVLPFALSADEVTAAFGENSELAVYDGDEGEGNVTVKFKKIDGEYKYITAGYPYMLWLENPVSGLKFTKDITATLNPETKGNTFDFVGVYTQTTTADGDYIVQGGEFRKASTSNFVRPFRAYLKLKSGATVRSLNFVVGDGSISTGIDAAEINGLEIEGAYNLSGQKVQNLKKGLYIINGKKVMVK